MQYGGSQKKIHGLIGGKGEWIFGGNNFSPIIIIRGKECARCEKKTINKANNISSRDIM